MTLAPKSYDVIRWRRATFLEDGLVLAHAHAGGETETGMSKTLNPKHDGNEHVRDTRTLPQVGLPEGPQLRPQRAPQRGALPLGLAASVARGRVMLVLRIVWQAILVLGSNAGIDSMR